MRKIIFGILKSAYPKIDMNKDDFFKTEKTKRLFAELERYIKQNYTGAAKKRHFFNEKPKFAASAKCEDIGEDAVCEMPMAAPLPSLEDAVKNIGESFSQRLLRFIDESGKTSVEIYKKANIDRKLFSKIQCDNSYQPKKKTAIAFALALELGLDDTKDLLASAGYALSPASVSDLIIEFFIKNEVYDIYTINTALYEHGQPVLE